MALSLPGNRLIYLSRDNLNPEAFERIIHPYAAWQHAENDYHYDYRWYHSRYIVNIDLKSGGPYSSVTSGHGSQAKTKLKSMIERGEVVCLNDVSVLPASLFYIDDNGALICRDKTAFLFDGALRIIKEFNLAVSRRDYRHCGGKPAPTSSRQLRAGDSRPEAYDTLNSKNVGRLLAAGGVYNGNPEGFHKTAEQLGGDALAGYNQIMDNKGLIIAGASVAAGLGVGRMRFPELEKREHFGARGASSGRAFNPDKAGGPIENLTTDGVKITREGIAIVEKHTSRFGDDPGNKFMVNRLKKIADGEITHEKVDLNYYTHECREYQRYCNLGWETGAPADNIEAHELWNNTHTATLEDYKLKGAVEDLYHPDAPIW